MKQSQPARKSRAPRSSNNNNNNNYSNSRKNHRSSNGQGNNRNNNVVRGNPKQHLDKYKTLAREAGQNDDRINEEYYYQFADHYQRLVNEQNARQPQQHRSEPKDNNDSENTSEASQADGEATDQDNQGQDTQNQDNQNQNKRNQQERRPRRSRHDNRSNNNEQQNAQPKDQPKDEVAEQPAVAAVTVDPAEQAQPVEVRPELDLKMPVETSEKAVVVEKPKRAPVRRKPRVKKEVVAAPETEEKAE